MAEPAFIPTSLSALAPGTLWRSHLGPGCFQVAQKCWRGFLLADWVVRRSLYYLLPPLVHTGLKHCAPRLFQRQIQMQFKDRFVTWVNRQSTQPERAELPAGGENAAAPPVLLPHPNAAPPIPPPDPAVLQEAAAVLARYRDAAGMPEVRPADLQKKIERYVTIAQETRIDRVRILREQARLEQMRGNDLVACAYRLRVMRLLGTDQFRDLLWVKGKLEARGFPAEAEAAEAMYGVHPARTESCRKLLEAAYQKHRRPPAPAEFAHVEDRRPERLPRVAIIVSLYNAAAKLPTFLKALQAQTLVRNGQAELILVDSGSPADEYRALQETNLAVELPYLYVRTARRETIQTAWNHGIALARAPYLSFLGADETIIPNALEVLAAELDADPALDWVQGNSLITDVDQNGAFVRDVMPYDRTGYTQDHVYLETCYLSWVGALYRKSIHERFGYYDGSFGAAGDTEFKGRVLPFLKTKCIPRLLGVFLNYPEERTTASPRAEIEDTRAWYLHRSLGGLQYMFQQRNSADAEQLLLLALQYRKSYVRHESTDLDYAQNVAEFLAGRLPGSPVLGLARGVTALLDAYRALDYVPAAHPEQFAAALHGARMTAERVQADLRATPWLQQATCTIFNDNRHEQHSFFW